MPDGESGTSCSAGGGGSEIRGLPSFSAAMTAPSDENEETQMGLTDRPQKAEKDPRKIARKYQLELCKKAVEENIIVYLGTGCGKTHIAVLLIYELGHLIRKPQKKVCIFLAPTVTLVQQQARVIENSIDFNVGTYCGGNRHLKSHFNFEKEISQYEVLVMTPQILLHNLHHCFIRMEFISLLIFDECHHAQVKSNHPYAQIMKVFYETNGSNLPRIFGMTASPVVGKGTFDQENIPKSINSLENLLNAKVYSVENQELESFMSSPVVKVYYYGPVMNDESCPNMICQSKLEGIKRECISSLSRKADNHQNLQSLRNMKKLLKKTHDNIIYCLDSLGLWGALQVTKFLLTGDHNIREELLEEKGNLGDLSLYEKYLSQAAKIFASEFAEDGAASDLSSAEVLKEPFLSKKLLRLIGILSTIRLQQNMKCIIFVNRVVTARSLSHILKKLNILASWKPGFLAGVNSGLKCMSRKNMKAILEKFQSGELNLLVATRVGEEGLDIQTCCLVIRFDLPDTVSSFIQSRGRARMPQSEYVFLVDSGNEKEMDLIKHFRNDEDRMNVEIVSRTSKEIFPRLEERLYKVDSTGASISSGYSISLLYNYCLRLPHDEFYDPKPEFYFFDDLGGTICNIVLPSNAPIRQIIGTPQLSIEAAKKDACLKAIEELHKLGVLNDYLLLESKDAKDEELEETSDSDSCSDEEGSLGKLHEMLVPSLLKERWDTSVNNVRLYSYYIKFIPDPDDRLYRKFGLFLKSPLPFEAERMELDLHLARHRSVFTKLLPTSITEFDKDEIRLAEDFHEISFKVILERSELVPEFVPLGMQDSSKSSISTFYLLLPVNLHNNEDTLSIDWDKIRRCLSSPIFRNPSVVVGKEIPLSSCHLQLANGCWSVFDVRNSLVYAIHKNLLYFVCDVIHGRNGYSLLKESSTESHLESISDVYGIHLKHPEQPLLLVKPLFNLRNLLHNRKPKNSESHELEEYFIELPPELCQMKIIGFSKDIGSSLSLLPSVMHRLENVLVAIELKDVLSASFSEAAEVAALRFLEALTTERCQERFSLERLEILGDAYLKFAVGRRLFLLHENLDEGQLTQRRSGAINNSNLFRLATKSNLQVYIRDQTFDPGQFFAFGHPCSVTCDRKAERTLHFEQRTPGVTDPNFAEIRCSKNHHWLHKKTVADVVEALVGAFIVDSGFKGANAFLRWIGINVDFEASQVRDACVASKVYIPLATAIDIPALENRLGYNFLHKGLLLQAFVHPSYNKHGGGCYQVRQRLEFLGDAVLDYLITSYLFTVYPDLKPGQLTDLRSLSVNNKVFANSAANRSLHKFLLCGSSYLSEAVRKYVDFLNGPQAGAGSLEAPKCPKVLGDLVESCMGAILLDTGFDMNKVWKVMLSFLDLIKNLSTVELSPIRDLHELCQSHNWGLQFLESKKGGIFSIEAEVTAKDSCETVSATCPNKKDGTKIAAQLMLTKLKGKGCITKSKSLEKVLKSSSRKDARLIGCNEAAIDVKDQNAITIERLKVEEPLDCTSYTDSKSSEASSSFSVKPVITRPLSEAVKRCPEKASGETHSDRIHMTGRSGKKTARSHLYEISVGNCWKPPIFECCEEEGPAHLKSFTFKVIVEVEEAPDMILECYGAPESSKKAAAENAAEGAMWYLEKAGFLH